MMDETLIDDLRSRSIRPSSLDDHKLLLRAVKEIERLRKNELELIRKMIGPGKSDIPCDKCQGPVVEFSVPNEAWNTIIREHGRETDQEYLCLNCFAKAAAERILVLEAQL